MVSLVGYSDGSWDLTIAVPRFNVSKSLRVKGEMHIGGILLQLSEAISEAQGKEDWSDYSLWWPDKNLWLIRTRSTLLQYGVQKNSELEFTRMHKDLNVIMPDLRIVKLRTNFSVTVFRVVIQLCQKLKLRHPEELSLSRKLEPNELKRNQGVSAVRRTNIPESTQGPGGGRKNSAYPNGSDSGFRKGSVTPEGTLERGFPMMTSKLLAPVGGSGTMSSATSISTGSLDMDTISEAELSRNPGISVSEALDSVLYCPKNYTEKARTNAGWLDSSRSLMEQGIRENSFVLLRFKYFNFYDLNPKYDKVRINQLYQQARWSVLSGENDCTEDEMFVFAAFQVLIDDEMQKQGQDEDDGQNGAQAGGGGAGGGGGGGGGLDACLDDLEMTLEGSSSGRRPSHIMKTPQLQDTLLYYRPKKLGLKSYKKAFFVLKDLTLSVFKDEVSTGENPKFTHILKECEVSYAANLSRDEFDIKLLIGEAEDSTTEICLRLDTTEKYAKWLVAFKLAAKGRTMADSSYDDEVSSLRSVVDLQRPSRRKGSSSSAEAPKFDPKSCIAPRFFKKISLIQALNRVASIYEKICSKKLREAQMEYIRAWKMLPDFGNAFFIVKFRECRREELLSISIDHMTRMDIQTGEPIKTWSYTTLENWSVNWDTMHVELTVKGQSYAFQCYTADCKTIHEFIGGYIFLMLRSPDKSQTLDEEEFQKLTGGRQ